MNAETEGRGATRTDAALLCIQAMPEAERFAALVKYARELEADYRAILATNTRLCNAEAKAK